LGLFWGLVEVPRERDEEGGPLVFALCGLGEFWGEWGYLFPEMCVGRGV
jgi:hypothetical protein